MSQYLDKQLAREAQRGRFDRVQQLLERGAAINKGGLHGWTPLVQACDSGHIDIVRLLLKCGADPNLGHPLSRACIRGNERIAIMLIAAGADVNEHEKSGPTPLNHAIGCGGSRVLVQSLIQSGASLDHRYLGMNLVEYAHWCGRPALVPLLRTRRRRALSSRT